MKNELRDFQITIGWFILWLITITLNRKWQSLSDFLTDNGYRYIGWGVYINNK